MIIAVSLRLPSIMVRRQGKKRMRAVLDSSNGEKKKEGESSLSRADAQGARDPKCKREEE
jgi:hypothetical protein